MYKRVGQCRKCGHCCKHFIILAGAISSFKEAAQKHGLKLIPNSDGKTFKCSMLTKNNRCRIYKDRPNACRTAPVKPNPKEWKCGYRFITIDDSKQKKAETRRALDIFYELKKQNR